MEKETNREIKTYLTRVSWAPVETICSKFSVTPNELSIMLVETLQTNDVRIDRNIVHFTG